MSKERISFILQPTLSGKYVSVRPLLESDREELYKVAADPLIWKQHPDKKRHTRSGFYEFFSESVGSGGALLVSDSVTGGVIGSSRYFGYDAKNNQVEIGWTFLARSHWGGQYNGELKQLMLEHAFRYVEAVVFYIDPDNRRSQKSVEKIGALRDKNRDNKGRVVYRIHKSEYAASANPRN